MDIQIDFRSGVPGYNQIVEQVQREIASGKLKPGDQLPTVRALAAELRINFNTVARAYRILDEMGVISTQHGRGTFIIEQDSAEASEQLRRDSLRALARRYLEETSRLGFSEKEAAQYVKKLTAED